MSCAFPWATLAANIAKRFLVPIGGSLRPSEVNITELLSCALLKFIN